MTDIENIAKSGKAASIKAMLLDSEIKNQALNKIAENLQKSKDLILSANKQDIDEAQKLLESGEINKSAYNRLKLDENKFRDMVQGVSDITRLEDLVGKII